MGAFLFLQNDSGIYFFWLMNPVVDIIFALYDYFFLRSLLVHSCVV